MSRGANGRSEFALHGKTGRMETKIGRIVKIDKFAPPGILVASGLTGAECA
jgi:hypothetical protein